MRTDDIDPSDPESWAREFLRRYREDDDSDPDPHPHTRAEHEAMLEAMRRGVVEARRALIRSAKPGAPPDPLIEELRHAEKKVEAELAESRRIRERSEDRELIRAQMLAQREATEASNALAEASNAQAAAMARWTKVLAWATVALIVATLVSAFIARS